VCTCPPVTAYAEPEAVGVGAGTESVTS